MTTGLTPYMSLAATAALLARREISPVDVVEAHLERLGRLEPALHAFITVTADQARAQARAAEAEIARGGYRGPLHGIPFGLKDLYATAGIRTTAHSRVLAQWVPDADAPVVTRMYQAGAVLLGKQAMSEFATGSMTEGPWPGVCNPWNPAYGPGGSSSGSAAAVAAGVTPVSLGSDTGGSVRLPAALTGCVGIRPTYGRVSRRGVAALAWSLDTCGPLARTVEDCAITLGAIAGYDPADPGSADVPVPDFAAALTGDVRGLRVGVERAYFFSEIVSPEVVAAVDAALDVLRGLGAVVVPIELPMLRHAMAAQTVIHMSESHSYHEARLRATPELYGASVRAYFRTGALIGAADYLQAQRVRQLLRAEIVAALRDRVHIIATPTITQPAEKLTDTDASARLRRAYSNLTVPFSLAGTPAISVPCGFAGSGLPIGLQLAGRPFDEATVFRCAHAYEQATPWHTRHPEL